VVVLRGKPDSANDSGVTFLSLTSHLRHFDSGGPTLAETGEEQVLRLLAGVARGAAGPALLIGPGDDAAVWQPAAGMELALTQDALVEDRDFRRGWITPWALGRRAFTVALSDLAAMGAQPGWCTATLCAPGSTQLGDVLEIQRGLVEAAADAGCAVAGGDVSDTPGGLVIDVAAGGTAMPGKWLRRDSGRVGDALAVTGRLGAAAAGLEVLLTERATELPGVAETAAAPPTDERLRWVEAFLAPAARIAEGQHLAAGGVRCGGDISDGLLVDAGRTAAASGCRAELWRDRIPTPDGLREAFPDTWLELALAGGEDFELLCAAPLKLLTELAASWPDGLAPLQIVGRLMVGSGVALLEHESGSPVALPRVRSRHWG
jgi:thiamine-monophosphate kinase